jgi:flagellin
MRAMLGATENRLVHAHDNLVNSVENASAARSRIRDTDYAAETMQLTRNQILQQAGTAMVAQANSLPNQALLLLRA